MGKSCINYAVKCKLVVNVFTYDCEVFKSKSNEKHDDIRIVAAQRTVSFTQYRLMMTPRP